MILMDTYDGGVLVCCLMKPFLMPLCGISEFMSQELSALKRHLKVYFPFRQVHAGRSQQRGRSYLTPLLSPFIPSTYECFYGLDIAVDHGVAIEAIGIAAVSLRPRRIHISLPGSLERKQQRANLQCRTERRFQGTKT